MSKGGAHGAADSSAPRSASALVRGLARRASKLRRVALRDVARTEALEGELTLVREQLEQATDAVRGLARRATGYRAQLRTLGIEPVVEDLSRCAFYRNEPGGCRAGCTIDPRCLVDEPDTGWPLAHRLGSAGPSREGDCDDRGR
ncbi:hypothetical protein C8E95_7133 [Pseudonocardia autotrophica]|uniref:Uncharacterized protein n=2 Tax=Pseudonocardia TaxID=1847 RepID=A0A1Y2MLG6_PSEAH|nr:hypothetical protein BG845_05673 [Pseudonocardia autotrophica]TDN65625.1 hypothetical protein C8E95_7133 [Pseudonocardia autotrophica]BBG05771.1 hypothetical protein Pdca_69800 [Pseudonocardia autotrophica]GEC27024.1 hypothetical protein PSA01_40530 [Pseudonocardia saturnea]